MEVAMTKIYINSSDTATTSNLTDAINTLYSACYGSCPSDFSQKVKFESIKQKVKDIRTSLRYVNSFITSSQKNYNNINLSLESNAARIPEINIKKHESPIK
jgi:hypothetical protein